MINIRQKGQEGEREVIRALEPIVRRILGDMGVPLPSTPILQRNQNQSAVGGSDLSNVFGLCIEVKRQEQLSVGTWWAQACAAADRNNEVPVLLYRQNRGRWKCVVNAEIPLPPANGSLRGSVAAVVTMEWQSFLTWFEQWVRRRIENGDLPRV